MSEPELGAFCVICPESLMVFGFYFAECAPGWLNNPAPRGIPLRGAGFSCLASLVKMDLTQYKKFVPRPSLDVRRLGWYLVPLSLVLTVVVWDLVTRFSEFPAFILPPPALVWSRFWKVVSDGSLLRHFWVTLQEVLAGLVLGVGVATVLGYGLAKSRTFERLLSPYIVASQAIPIVAIAPLLIIWFEPGLLSKVLISALIVFFPVLVNTIVGIRSVPEELQDMMRSLQATRWQTMRFLEIPAALPVFLGGLRIGATLAVIGAVVGEFVGADRGLGFLVNVGRGQYDTALVFVAVITLILMAISLYGLIIFIEHRLLSWQQRPDQAVQINQ